MSRLQLQLTPYMEAFIAEGMKISGKSKTFTLDMLLFRIEQLARNGKIDATWGNEWVEASALVNARGLGAKHEDPVQVEGGEEIAFDISLLEKSGKSKTGFAGVYATTGNSFRALVPDPASGGSRYLPSRKTALQAAIDRYRHFDTYGIPYGNVGWHVEVYKNRHPEWTTERALVEMCDFMNGPGGVYGLKNPYTLDEVEKTLARHRAVNKIPREKWSQPMHPRDGSQSINDSPPSTLDVVVCCVCEQPIEENEPFSPHGKNDFAHAGCAS